jgi:2-keto-3-deoxy-6-phosphogluconate aldolase
MKDPIFAEFHKIGVIPVLEIDSVELAQPFAESLLAGGSPIAEGTLRTAAAIKSISNPFPQLRFIPIGGIRSENVAEYLQMEKIPAVGGSWMAKRQMIADGKFDEITRMAKEASEIVKHVRRNHL